MIRPQRAAEILGLSIQTIYDWKYRAKLRKVPESLFIKLNRTLYLRTDVLKEWITSQNPSLR
ncbi:MAG: helix-turn-helix domain-containing protein [Bradymonadales bacterium]|nr:MAG: helix-turn-helix domain-containing protein [Bradymonadales bacterium]